MNADSFRELYSYHFTLNRKLWDEGVLSLSEAQFTQSIEYSVGSIHNQIVHMMSVDERWFAGLRGVAIPDHLNPVHFASRKTVRDYWDNVETSMRVHLQDLDDSHLLQDNDGMFKTWQILFHVLNHGTDHRSQTLHMLNQFGIDTFPQDYVLLLMGRI